MPLPLRKAKVLPYPRKGADIISIRYGIVVLIKGGGEGPEGTANASGGKVVIACDAEVDMVTMCDHICRREYALLAWYEDRVNRIVGR